MIRIKPELVNDKDICFPKMRPVPLIKCTSWWSKIFKFTSFRRKFETCENHCIWCKTINAWIFIPKGFIMDGASVPKMLSSLYSSTGVLFYGSLPHDFAFRYSGLLLVNPDRTLYYKELSKSLADEIFNNLCKEESGMSVASRIAKFALTLFGGSSWQDGTEIGIKIDFPELYEIP